MDGNVCLTVNGSVSRDAIGSKSLSVATTNDDDAERRAEFHYAKSDSRSAATAALSLWVGICFRPVVLDYI